MSRLVLAALLLTLPWPLEALKPDWLDRVLHNPRERTEVAREAHAAGDPEGAADAAEEALRIAGQLPTADDGEGAGDADGSADGDEDGAPPAVDPRLPFNAGTAQLAAGDEGRALELLGRAARHADAELPGLAAAAHYNLGNARLADGDTAGAVAAFKDALRRDPGDAAAKHNLEVALRRLEEENKLPLQQPRETPGGDRSGDEETGDQEGRQQPAEDDSGEGAPEPGESQRPDDGRPRGPQPPPEEGGAAPEPPRESPLPRFEDQPDMTAEQAAALLQAVENLERRQRQEEAAERARRRSERGEKDW